MRIGIYGGTFNPMHIGHLIVIESVREQLQFDRLFFVPSASTPNKNDPTLAPAADRLQMARLALEGNSECEVSDIEIARGVAFMANAAGGKFEVINLPQAGIKGNSHMIMMDRNSDQVAGLIQEWLAKQGLFR